MPNMRRYNKGYLDWCREENVRQAKLNRKRKNEEEEVSENSSDEESDEDMALNFRPRKKVRIHQKNEEDSEKREAQTQANTEKNRHITVPKKADDNTLFSTNNYTENLTELLKPYDKTLKKSKFLTAHHPPVMDTENLLLWKNHLKYVMTYDADTILTLLIKVPKIASQHKLFDAALRTNILKDKRVALLRLIAEYVARMQTSKKNAIAFKTSTHQKIAEEIQRASDLNATSASTHVALMSPLELTKQKERILNKEYLGGDPQFSDFDQLTPAATVMDLNFDLMLKAQGIENKKEYFRSIEQQNKHKKLSKTFMKLPKPTMAPESTKDNPIPLGLTYAQYFEFFGNDTTLDGNFLTLYKKWPPKIQNRFQRHFKAKIVPTAQLQPLIPFFNLLQQHLTEAWSNNAKLRLALMHDLKGMQCDKRVIDTVSQNHMQSFKNDAYFIDLFLKSTKALNTKNLTFAESWKNFEEMWEFNKNWTLTKAEIEEDNEYFEDRAGDLKNLKIPEQDDVQAKIEESVVQHANSKTQQFSLKKTFFQ